MTASHIHMISWAVFLLVSIVLGLILRKPFRKSGNVVRILLIILTISFGIIGFIIMIWPQKNQKKITHKRKKTNT